jgi:hypothetical protein
MAYYELEEQDRKQAELAAEASGNLDTMKGRRT